MAKKKKTSSDPLLQRAAGMSELQYGPQMTTLMQAMQDAKSTRVNKIKQARATGKYTEQSERAGQKTIGKSLDQVGAAATQGNAYVDSLFANPAAGAPASAIIAAIGNSRSAVPTNVAAQKASAVRDSEKRVAQGRSGATYAEGAARAEEAGTLGKLRSQLGETQNAAGMKTALEYENLVDAANRDALDQQKFALDIQAEGRMQGEADSRNAERDGKGKKNRFTPQDRRTTRSKVESSASLYSNGVVVGERENETTGEAEPVTWTKDEAKKGIVRDAGGAKRVKPADALKRYESQIAKEMTAKYDDVLGRAIAQTVVWGGVGEKTRKQVYRRYEIKLPLMKRKSSRYSAKPRSHSRTERGY